MISQHAQTAFKRGHDWEERENPDKAINAYHEAIAIEPDWVAPHQRLGMLYLGLGRYDEAMVACQQARPLVPAGDGSVDDLVHVLGQIQSDLLDPSAYHYYVMARDMPDEQLDDKMALCQKALSLSQSFAPPYAEMGRILLVKGQLNQARVVLERGLDYNPSPYAKALLLFYLGHVLLRNRQFGEALSAFRQVVALDANLSVTGLAAMQLEAAQAAGHT
jgi:tetratricopeptide (TPR) repeat protein